MPVNPNCAVMGSFHRNEQKILECGDNKDKASPSLSCFIYLSLCWQNPTTLHNRIDKLFNYYLIFF